MLLPASAEFVTLCQSQIALLTQGFGAALSIVYLTEELTDIADAQLVPVVAYPEAVASWGEEQILAFLARSHPRRLPSSEMVSALSRVSNYPDNSSPVSSYPDNYPNSPPLPTDEPRDLYGAERALLQQQQMLLPLIHQDMVMGILLTARADRPWTEAEQTQIKKIADTLAIACILDQRTQWMAQDVRQQRLLRDQKHEIYDNLLHQFRNPLTALRTFGKLLVRRLRPSDANQTVAESIVRESDRLQDLLKQLESVIELDDSPLSLSADAASTDHDSRLSPARSPLLLPSSTFLAGAPLQLEFHPIAEALQPILESAEAIAQDRLIDLEVDVPTDLPPVQMDVKALREVVNNLIDNALKYTPARGRVDVRVVEFDRDSEQKLQRWQAIAVMDTGPGIPPEDLTHLFERHYRGVQAQTDIPGTGLGLAIARDLVQQMQGEIRLFSPARTSGLLVGSSNSNPTEPGTAAVVWLLERQG